MFNCRNNDMKVIILSQIFMSFFGMSFAIDSDCNYHQEMSVNSTYYVYNKEYPGNSGPNENCRWIAVAPNGYKIDIKCQLEMPQSSGCEDNYLAISLDGDENLQNAKTYCGYGDLTLETNGNKVSIGLITTNAVAGRFMCTLKAKKVEASPSQCECGKHQEPRIVGGTETEINEYPMMAGLVDFQMRDLFCGATIIARFYALTAAHCLSKKSPSIVGLLVGEHDISTGADTNSTRLLRISRFSIHPSYNENSQTVEYDIAVVMTETEIIFSTDVGPSCLPFKYYQDYFANDVVQALGWGTTEFTGPKSEVLLKTDLYVLSIQDCYTTANGSFNQMCTFKAGHDACQSDSGGPLMWKSKDNGRLYNIGIISTGVGCATKTPALNTRVTSYLMWIASVTPGAVYCMT